MEIKLSFVVLDMVFGKHVDANQLPQMDMTYSFPIGNEGESVQFVVSGIIGNAVIFQQKEGYKFIRTKLCHFSAVDGWIHRPVVFYPSIEVNVEGKVFEWEILQHIKQQDSVLLPDPTTYVLKYDRNRYYQARDFIAARRKVELLKQGADSNTIHFPNDEHSPVPGWGWK